MPNQQQLAKLEWLRLRWRVREQEHASSTDEAGGEALQRAHEAGADYLRYRDEVEPGWRERCEPGTLYIKEE